ncbi:MAG: alpha/beta hydrolase [Anaerolineales bacterium]
MEVDVSSSLRFLENAGKGSEPIVFVHGGGISSRMWRYALEQLSEFHCLAPDLPGHGYSREIRPCPLDLAVEGTLNLIQEKVPSREARIVGTSVGVPVCVSLSNRYPEHVEALFLSGPTPRFNPVASWMMNLISRPILSLVGSEGRSKMVGQMMDLSARQMEEFHEDLAQITPDLVTEINDLLESQEDPSTVNIPAEPFVGEDENGSTKKRCQQLTTAYGNEDHAVVLDHGHAWPLEAPDLFVDAVKAWASGGRPADGFRYVPNFHAA